jgi:outer membrane protein OmpA-like peptidoglycan-associated protein
MKKITLLFLLMLSSFITQAQSYIGFLTDNYSGVHGVISNPANIVDSRFKTDINLIGAGVFGVNDYYGVNVLDALKDGYDFDLSANKTPTSDNNVMFNADVMGPSFMFNINRNSSLAIFTRARSFANVHSVNGAFFDNLESDDSEDFSYNEGNIKTLGNAWGELGITYARVIMNNNEQFLKGGVSLKYLQGAGSAYVSGNNVFVDYDADGTAIPGGTTGSLTSTGELTFARFDDIENEDYEYEFVDNATGFGVDLGFVYEWRPNYADYNRTNAQGDSYTLKDRNKYKLKLGLSITDIGSINYKDGIQETYDVTNTGVSEEDLEDAENLEDILNTFYTLIDSKVGYKTQLPTALHLNADWSFNRRFYVNLNTDLSLISKTKVTGSRMSNIVSLTPRFESKFFSFYVPLSVVEYNGFQAGAGLRLGPLYVGSGSVLTALASDNSKGADVYAGLKIPVYQGRAKDKDGDGVIDKLDGCPREAGPIDNNGCPWGDKDEDGVLDNIDKCIDEAGPKENFGCPWGDTDGDTILDNVDTCPDVAGPVENNGCPWKDTDGDTVFDKDDNCPEVAGAVENNGCPWKDTDGDGVLDKDDNCPEVVGTIANKGCPEVSVAIQRTLNAYAKTILFNSGKSTIKSQSKTVLDNIIGILNEYPDARFSIEGHTDSSGSDAFNQKLSESRASAVMTYLISNGVASNRLTAKGYGESKPIDNNATKAGRDRNRRVEINLVK